MTNKMKLSSWPHWPSCNQLKTHSFRSSPGLLKTLNPTFHNSPESLFSDSDGFSGDEKTRETEYCIENVIRGLNLKSTERLFFKPEPTSSIFTESNKPPPPSPPLPFFASAAISPTFEEKGMLCSIDSKNPYLDFKKSMEEMIESSSSSSNNGVFKNWEFLEDLLCWYLNVNEKSNHGYICEAFVDLIFGFCFSTTTNSSSPFSSDVSNTCSSSSLQAEKIVVEDCDDDNGDDDEAYDEIKCFSTS